MASNKSVKTAHLFLLIGYLISCVIATLPLCGKIDGDDEHKIYFLDNDSGIRTIEMNGTIVGCIPSARVDTDLRADTGESLLTMSSFRPNITKCAGYFRSFCSSDDNYPTDYVHMLLHKHWHMLSFAFHNDVMDPDVSTIDTVIENEADICRSNDEIVYPRSGQTMNGTNLYIVNTPEHKQGVRISVCQEKNKPCQVSEKIPFPTQCEQRYVYRELLALSTDGVPIKESFKIPSFCTCKIYYNNIIVPNRSSDETLNQFSQTNGNTTKF